MKGVLKSKSPLNQFILLVAIALVCLFVVGLPLTMLAASALGIDIQSLGEPLKSRLSPEQIANALRMLQAVQFISLLVVPSLICATLFSTNRKRYLQMVKPSNSWYFVIGTLIMLVAIPFTNYLGELNQRIPFPENMARWMKEMEVEATNTFQALLSLDTPKDFILNVISIALFAGIGEELLFRGLAQRLLIKLFKNHHAGIIIAAALFSALHLQFFGFLPRFALGILLGYIYWYSGSIWVAMLAHFLYDATLITIYHYGDKTQAEATIPPVLAAISLLLTAALFIWMHKQSTTTMEKVYADDNIPVKDHPFDTEIN